MEHQKPRIEIELRSDEFQEIVQQSPRWMIRSGISLIFGILILLLAGSYFFRYPDVIKADIVVLTQIQSDGLSSMSNNQSDSIQLKKNLNSEIPTVFIGRITLSIKESHKVAAGQKVNIRMEDYPSMEFGMLIGIVKNISAKPENGNYSVEVQLPQDMKTNYNIPLKFSQEMKGSAEIITEDMRLIQRFFNPVKSMLKHRVSPSE